MKVAPRETANYYYDLGTIAYRGGQYGPAVAYLEKADRLRPHDTSIRHNLRLARTELAKRLGEDRMDPASLWTESVADHVPIEEVRGTIGLVGLILIGLWLRSYRKSRDIRRSLAHPASLLTAAAFLLTVGLYLAERTAASHPPAIVLETETVRSGPGEKFAEVARIEPGSKLRLLGPESSSEKSEIWRQVRFGADDIGWVPASSLLLL